eukprot:85528-Hanusia_phi.AAC.4
MHADRDDQQPDGSLESNSVGRHQRGGESPLPPSSSQRWQVMEDGTKGYFKQLRAQDKVAKVTNSYTTIEGKVKGFLTALPLVSDLRHPSMRPRHWNMLRQLTGKQFDETSPEFDLRTLNDLHLDEFEDDVGEVSDDDGGCKFGMTRVSSKPDP